MNKALLYALLCLATLACEQSKLETPTKGRLRVAVAESHAALIQKEADEFHRLYPNAEVTVVSTTTRESMVYLLSDSVQLIVTDRALNAEEQGVADSAGIKVEELKIAEDALAAVVNRQNPIEHISLESLKKIVNGRSTDWSELPESKWSGRIELALTGRNSGVYELLKHTFFNLAEEISLSFIAATQSEVVDFVAAHPQAIGLVSALWAPNGNDQGQNEASSTSVRVLAVADSSAPGEFVKLHQANVYRSLYPLHYPVYLCSTAGEYSIAAGFSAFIASATGQKVILNAGLVPATMPVRVVQIHEE